MDKRTDNIEIQARCILLDRASAFTISGSDEVFRIHYPSYGIMMLASEILDEAGLDRRDLVLNPYAESLRLSSVSRKSVCRVISLYCVSGKAEALGAESERLSSVFLSSMTVDELAKTLLMCLSLDNIDSVLRHYSLTRENDRYRRAVKVKMQNSDSVGFGGLTVYGSMFDPVMERYGWTLDYVIWGISYANLRLIIADMPRSLLLSKEERRRAGITNEKAVKAETITDINKLREMFPD